MPIVPANTDYAPEIDPKPQPVDDRVTQSIAPALDKERVETTDERVAQSILPFVNARTAALKASLQNAVETDADQHAKILQTADKLGVPSRFVEEDPQFFQAKDRYSQMDADTLQQRHPELATWLSNPDNSKVAQDDLHVLRTMDNALRSITDPSADPTGRLPSGYTFTRDGGITAPPKFGLSQYYHSVDELRQSLERDQEHAAIAEMESDDLFQRQLGSSHFLLGLVSPYVGYSADSASVLRDLEAASMRQEPGFWGDAQRFAGGLVGSIPLMFAGGALAEAATSLSKIASLRAFMKPSTSALGRLGQKVVTAVANPNAQGAEKFIQRGVQGALVSQPFAVTSGLKTGAVDWLIQTTIPGAMGPGPIAKAFVPGMSAASAEGYHGIATRLLKDFGFQGSQNAAITLASAIHAKISGTDPDALDAGRLSGSLASTFTLGGAAGVLFGLSPAIHQEYIRQANDARMATSFADRLAMVVEQVKSSKLGERSPERLAQLLQQLTTDGKRHVFMQSDSFDEVVKAQGLDPNSVARNIGAEASYREAQAHGGDVQIPISGFVDLARQVDDASGLILKAKQEPGALTAEAAQAFYQEKPEEIASLAKEAKKIADDAEHARDPEAEKVYQDVLRQRLDNGATQDRAQYEARLMSAWQEVKARRLADEATKRGEQPTETAWTLYEPAKLNIRQEIPGVESTGMMDLMLDRLRSGDLPSAREIGGESLIEYLRPLGVKDYLGDLASMDPNKTTKPGERNLMRDNGISLDEAAQRAFERGYIKEHDINLLLDAIGNEMRGDPVFRPGEENPHLAGDKAALDDLKAYIDEAGLSLKMTNAEIKAAMQRQGMQDTGAPLQEAAQTVLAQSAKDADMPIDETGKNKSGDRPVLGKEKVTVTRRAEGSWFIEGPQGTLEVRRAQSLGGDKPVFRVYDSAGAQVHHAFSASDALSWSRFYVGKEGARPIKYDGKTILFQSGKGIQRGSISFGEPGKRDYNITLTPKQNLSTVLHEFAHFFLQDFSDFVKRADVPESMKSDFKVITDWLGITDLDKITTEQHEKFADGFLAYLKEGKAPSTGLRSAFIRFRSWLTRLFASGQIHAVKLNDEVRGVFDRMLATDEEIKVAQEANGITALFLDAESAGKTPEEFAAYQKTVEHAHTTAIEQLQKELVDDLEREHRVWYKEEKAKLRAKIEANVNERPAYKALMAMQDEGTVKINKDDILARYGEGAKAILARLPGPGRGRNNRGQHIISTEGGITAQAAADLFGFGSGDELITALIDAPNRKQTIEAETLAEMKRLHGDALTDGTLHEKAILAVQNDERGKVLMSELKALRKMQREVAPIVKAATDEQAAVAKQAEREELESQKAERRARDLQARIARSENKEEIARLKNEYEAEVAVQKAALKEERRAVEEEARQRKIQRSAAIEDMQDRIPSLDVMRITAERLIAGKQIRDLTPDLYQKASRKAGAEAFAALKKQDYQAAGDAKQREILAYAMHRAALDAKARAEKSFRYLRRFDQAPTRERVGKAGGWEWTVTNADGTQQTADSEKAAKQAADAHPGSTWERTSGYLDQIDAILNRYEFRRITLKNINRRKSLAAWIEEQKALGADVVIPPYVADEVTKTNYREMTVDQITAVHDSVKNIESLAIKKNKLSALQKQRELAESVGELSSAAIENAKGKKATPFSRTQADQVWGFFANVDANLTKLSALARAMDGEKDGGVWWDHIVRPLNEAEDRRTQMRYDDTLALQAARKEWGKGREVYTVKNEPILGNSISHMGKIMMALNWGTAKNRERLLNGGKRKLTEDQVHGILAHLDEKDWQYVRAVAGIIGKYASEIKAQEQRLSGVTPDMEEPVPVHTKFGTFDGWYFPIKYDGELNASARTSDISTEGPRHSAMFSAPHTRDGFVQSRVTTTGKDLLLDERVITQHLNEVTHRLSHEDVFQDLGKLLRDKTLQDAIIDHYGMQAFNVYRETIANIAQGDVAPQKGIEQGIHHLRTGVSLSVMAYNVMSAIHQIPGMTQSIVRVGPKWFALGLKRFLGDALKMESTAAWVTSKSTMMRNRTQTFRPETNERLNKTAFATLVGPVRDNAYYLMQKMQFAVDIPTWIAGHEKALAEGRTDVEAVAMADQTVLDTQGSGSIKDLSKIQRSGEWAKLFNVFGHFFSTTYQLTKGSVRRTDFTDPASIGRLAADMVLLYTAPILMTAALDKAVQAVIGAPAQAKKDDSVLRWLAKQHASYAMNMIPGVRELAGSINGYSYSGTAGTRGFAELSNLIQQFKQGEADHGLERAVVGSAGILFHLPAVQTQRVIDGVLSFAQGKTNASSILLGPAKNIKK